jgi:hypothetical protein
MTYYKNAFPNFDHQIPQIEGFSDDSWKNDACPSLVKQLPNGAFIKIYIDYLNQDLSDFSDLPKSEYFIYSLGIYDSEENYQHILNTNNLDDVLSAIQKIN